jgi:CheY-like chemotaxis protein
MKTVLVVSSYACFGELIRQNLEEMGHFHVHVAGDKPTAISFVEETGCPLAFLDTSLAEQDPLEIGPHLRQVNPRIRFVVASEAGWH